METKVYLSNSGVAAEKRERLSFLISHMGVGVTLTKKEAQNLIVFIQAQVEEEGED